MGLLVRTLWVLLLALSVPAQGVAAATMAFCGPNQHGQTALPRLSATAAHTHIGSAAQAPHGHDVFADQPDEDESGSASADAPAKLGQADEHKCSACASCCSAGAILSMVLTVPAPVVSRTVFISVVPTVDAFAADRLDRPPRVLRA